MAFLEINHTKIVGMSAAVPSQVEYTVNIYEKWGGVRTLPLYNWHRETS